jgi:hypothetical protein
LINKRSEATPRFLIAGVRKKIFAADFHGATQIQEFLSAFISENPRLINSGALLVSLCRQVRKKIFAADFHGSTQIQGFLSVFIGEIRG